MVHLLSVLALITSIVGFVKAAPTRETINYSMGPVENYSGVHRSGPNVVGGDCVNIQDTSLPTSLKLSTSDPGAYMVETHQSLDCNDDDKDTVKLPGKEDMLLNNRHPICSFKLKLDENPSSITGTVKVAFHLQSEVYSKEFTIAVGRNPHDLCTTNSYFKFAQKITLYSENSDVQGIEVFSESTASHEPITTANNETNIVSETRLLKKVVQSFKIIKN